MINILVETYCNLYNMYQILKKKLEYGCHTEERFI